jgi:cytochrome c biogenesis protein CcmG/thiol:disulfide interchange protein DsbE
MTETRRRRPHTALIAAVVIGCVMALFVAVLATRKSAADQQALSPLLDKPAPEITGTSLNGGSVQLSGLHGKFVLVNFFASWCVPCHEEHPQLITWLARHATKGDAAIVGVTFEDSDSNARAFMKDNGGSWPVLADPKPDFPYALAYGVRGPPESFLVSPDGFVLAKFVGPVTADGLDRLLTRVNGGSA